MTIDVANQTYIHKLDHKRQNVGQGFGARLRETSITLNVLRIDWACGCPGCVVDYGYATNGEYIAHAHTSCM